jgi:hypothetical protein
LKDAEFTWFNMGYNYTVTDIQHGRASRLP